MTGRRDSPPPLTPFLREPMRTLPLLLLLLAAAALPAAAQLPAGWRVLPDRPGADTSSALRVTAEADGALRFATGPVSGVYWREGAAAGDYAVSATFTQERAPRHPEAYGIFLMGTSLPGADQSYWYFLARGDGRYSIKHRAGAEVHTIVDWTEHPALRRAGADGRATNALEAVAAPDSLRFLANGQPVIAFPRSVAPNADGAAGLRINHGLEVRVADFKVVPLWERGAAPAAPRGSR